MDMAFLILLALSPSGAAQDVYVTPRVIELDACRRIQRSRRDQERFVDEFKELFPKVSRVTVRCQALTLEQLDRLQESIAGATK